MKGMKPPGDRRSTQLYKRVKVRNNLAVITAIKRNEVLIHATPWMTLENITLSEKSQSRKVMYCILPFI